MKKLLRFPLLPFARIPGRRRTVINASRPLRSRRLLLASVVLGLAAGLVFLAAAAFGLADRAASHPAAHPFVGSLGEDKGAIYDRPVVTRAPSPTPAATPAPAADLAAVPPPAPLRDVPYRMVINKIGVNADVVTYGLDANLIPEVPLNSHDVAWYDFSAAPGSGGNAVFAGHVTWNGRAVFYHLDELAPGDEVVLEAANGKRLSYTVSQVFLVDPHDPNSLAVMSSTATDTMTIITCGGSPYYVGGLFRYDYTNRLVVRARLNRVVDSAQAPPSINIPFGF